MTISRVPKIVRHKPPPPNEEQIAATEAAQADFVFDPEDMARAEQVVAELDKWRASGNPVPEWHIIAQALHEARIAGAQTRRR